MKRTILTALAALLALVCLALPAGAAGSVVLSANNPAYGENVTRVHLTLYNNGRTSIALERAFRLEKKADNAWSEVKWQGAENKSGQLDAAGVQSPVAPGGTVRLGAYLGGYRERDPKGMRLPFSPGVYRMVIEDKTGTEYFAQFTIVRGEVLAGTTSYRMAAQRAAYDGNIDRIGLTIWNLTAQESSCGEDYRLQRQTKDGWEEVKPEDGQEIIINDIAMLMPPQSEQSIEISLAPYPKPLPAGRYRILKFLTEEGATSAEFDILPTASALKLETPDKLTLSYADGTRSGAVTLTADEEARAALDITHELLAFQKTKAPSLPNEGATMEISSVANHKITKLHLAATEQATYLQTGSDWYVMKDAQVLSRLSAHVENLGGFLPQTGESLISALQALEPFRSIMFTPRTFTTPFSLKGWASDKSASGIDLSIYEFPSASAVNRQARNLSDGGYRIGREYKRGEVVSFEYQDIAWEAAPHFYQAGARLVLYCGDDPKALSSLEALLGPQVNSAERDAKDNSSLE